MLIHDDVIKWKPFPRYWPFVRGIHRSPVNSPHKGQWRGALMFSLICVWINGWVNNREAGDLRRYRAHYDVTLMYLWCDCNYISSASTSRCKGLPLNRADLANPIGHSNYCLLGYRWDHVIDKQSLLPITGYSVSIRYIIVDNLFKAVCKLATLVIR